MTPGDRVCVLSGFAHGRTATVAAVLPTGGLTVTAMVPRWFLTGGELKLTTLFYAPGDVESLEA